MPRQVHIFDPQLTGVGGHYFNHDFQLVRELQRRNIPVSLAGRKGSTIESCSDVKVDPLFTQDIFHEVGTDAIVWTLENFHAVNSAFLADLSTVDPARLDADDLIYFPNILQNQTHAVALWLAQLPPARRPAVALMYRFLNHAMDYVAQRPNKDVIALCYRYAVRFLLSTHPRALICADTAELTDAYHQITSAPVVELPNPMDVSALLASTGERPANQRPVVVYQGHASALRGLHFLPEIIVRTRGLQPRPRFVIQVQTPDAALAPVVQQLERLQGDDVQLVHGPLSQSAYFEMLASADIVLLPYSPTFYGFGSSGVFTEAASVGKVVVASPNTVPARQGAAYKLGVVVASAWTPEAMATAVTDALAQLYSLQRQAQAAAPQFRKENCAQAFWDRLLAATKRLPA